LAKIINENYPDTTVNEIKLFCITGKVITDMYSYDALTEFIPKDWVICDGSFNRLDFTDRFKYVGDTFIFYIQRTHLPSGYQLKKIEREEEEEIIDYQI